MTAVVPEVPVVVPFGGTVAIKLNTDHARALANVLAHYDLLVNHLGPSDHADGYQPEVFHRLLLQLHSTRNKALALQAEHGTTFVPLVDGLATSTRPPLRSL